VGLFLRLLKLLDHLNLAVLGVNKKYDHVIMTQSHIAMLQDKH